MDQPIKLLGFKKVTHALYTAYCMANIGMEYLACDLESMDDYNPDGMFQIDEKDEGNSSRTAWSEIPTKLAIESMHKDGLFSVTIAYSMLVRVFATWENQFREQIAKEVGCHKDNLMCDVIGDLREIRNMIEHNNSIITKKCSKKLKVLTWVKTGPFILNSHVMKDIQKTLNTMSVYVKAEI